MTLQEMQIEFLQKLKRHLDLNHEKDGFMLQQDIKEACRNMVVYQKRELVIPIETISITFLNTSYYMKNPKLRILFFAQGMLWKEPMMHMDCDASWLTKPLKEYKERLKEYAGEQKKSREWIAVEERNMLRLLLKLSAYFIKYDVIELSGCDELRELFKCSEFLISFGEYMDWQLPLYMERENVDIFQCEKDTSLRYREFKDIVYRKKAFENLDLTGARFINCKFNRCTMKQVIWNDVIFKNCSFDDVKAEGGEICGTRYESCLFHKCEEKDVKREQSEEGGISGFFRETEWIDCEVEEDGILYTENE